MANVMMAQMEIEKYNNSALAPTTRKFFPPHVNGTTSMRQRQHVCGSVLQDKVEKPWVM